MPDASVDSNQDKVYSLRDIDVPNVAERGISFPEEYDLVRGATTMSMWAVPRVDPWFDMLVASLSGDVSRLTAVAEGIGASWFTEVPWLLRSAESQSEVLDCRLWRAALRVLLEAHRDEGDRFHACR